MASTLIPRLHRLMAELDAAACSLQVDNHCTWMQQEQQSLPANVMDISECWDLWDRWRGRECSRLVQTWNHHPSTLHVSLSGSAEFRKYSESAAEAYACFGIAIQSTRHHKGSPKALRHPWTHCPPFGITLIASLAYGTAWLLLRSGQEAILQAAIRWPASAEEAST
jgi:hypothetical protein